MTLLRTLPRIDGSVLREYKSKSGNITYTLRNEIAGRGITLKVMNCDAKGDPKIIRDVAKGRNDVYIKAEDGATILKQGDKTTTFPNLVFNKVCEILFKQ